MPAPPAIRVCPVTPALRDAVLGLRARPEQDGFVSPPARTLPDAEQCPGSEPMAILLGEAVVGFYCVAAPVRDSGGATVAAVSCSMPAHVWERKQEIAREEIGKLTVRLSGL